MHQARALNITPAQDDSDIPLGHPVPLLQWLQPGNGEHRLFTATGDVSDGAGHSLVTAYPVLRPDGQWAVLIINKDQDNEHQVTLTFDDRVRHRSGGFAGPVAASVFGKAEYQWHPEVGGGTAKLDGPPRQMTLQAGPDAVFTLPKASIIVLRGKVAL